LNEANVLFYHFLAKKIGAFSRKKCIEAYNCRVSYRFSREFVDALFSVLLAGLGLASKEVLKPELRLAGKEVRTQVGGRNIVLG
jgi:hypothetical protein